MKKQLINTFASMALVLALSSVGAAAEWGDLKVRFTYDGPAPKPAAINITKDAQFCGQFGLLNESLVVNKENGGVRDVVVFLYNRGSTPPIHPDYKESAMAEVVLDNKKCRFEPRIAVMRTSQTLVLKNSDSVAHNTNYQGFNNADNVLIPSGGIAKKMLPVQENRAIPVACNIHPWMKGWILVRDNPYGAVSDKDGNLVIKNLPVGEWTFQFYQEELGYVAKLKLNGKPTSWTKGRPKLEIKSGMNDLGEIKFKLKDEGK